MFLASIIVIHIGLSMREMSMINMTQIGAQVISIRQTLQDFAMLRLQLLTQIQRFPANSARRCNFNTSPQLSRKFNKSLSSPTTLSLPSLHQGRKFCPADMVQTLAEF